MKFLKKLVLTMPTKKTTKEATKVKKVAKKATKKVAKKTTKKAAVKKTAKKATTKRNAKKSTRRTKAKKPLVYSTDSTSFWVSDGQVLNNLMALHDAFDAMAASVYKYHATGTHNDFANWVEVVLCDDACAKDLRKAKTKTSAKTVVVKHLKYYKV